MTNNLIQALCSHASIIARCTQAQAEIAAKTAKNMHCVATGQPLTYSEKDFMEIELPGENYIIGSFYDR